MGTDVHEDAHAHERGWRWWVGVGLLVGAPVVAEANGRMPGASDVAFGHEDADYLVVRASFGVVQSFDRGASWQWICEQAIATNGVIADPPLALVADGTTVLLPPTGGALRSRDRGCSWEHAPTPLAQRRGVDLTLDPADPARLLALTSTIQEVDDQGFGTYENLLIETHDNTQHWDIMATLPDDFEAETVEIAASDVQRIYVSGTASRNPRVGVLLRSDDRGAHWTQTTLDLPAGTGSMLISAIDPRDPDRLWVRVPARGDTIGLLSARLYWSDDKGATFRMLADTKRGMFGFALSPDGSTLAYGGPSDGLFVGPSDGSAPFKKVSSLGVRCLRWPAPEALYVCATEPRDGFSLGISRDMGASVEGLYRLAETCPAECPDGSGFAGVCQEAWGTIRTFVGASGAMCAVPWAAPVNDGDASVMDAGSQDAESPALPSEGAAPEMDDAETTGDDAASPMKSAKEAGCSCGTAESRQSSFGADLSVLALCGLWFAQRRTGRKKSRSVVCRLLLLCLTAAGCNDEVAKSHDDAGDAGTDDEAAAFQGCPDSTPSFALGMSAKGDKGHITAVLREASGVPPVRYFNDWTLEFTDADGMPLEDVAVVSARAYMRVHNHYGTPDPTLTQHHDEPALFDFQKINLFMRGPWEVQLSLHSDSAGDDDAVFNVCVDE